MNQIAYKKGTPIEFMATKDFALGNFGVKVIKGTDLQFDGSTVTYAGDDYNFPQLRAAVTAGWLVLTEDYQEGNPDYNRRVSANIQMRSPTDSSQAKSVSTIAEADERIVMSSADHAETVRSGNQRKVASSSTGVGEAQEGVAVRRLSSPSKPRTALTAESAGNAIRAANNVQIVPGQGLTQEQMLERMTEEEAEEYLAKKEAVRANYNVGTPKTTKQVGKVKSETSTSPDGMTVTTTFGGGIETWDGDEAEIIGTIKKTEGTAPEESGVKFVASDKTHRPRKRAAAVAPEAKPANITSTLDVRRSIAKRMCPDFPDSYDFSATDKKKIARLQADFEDRSDVLHAVFAAESDDFKSRLVAEFPEVFQI